MSPAAESDWERAYSKGTVPLETFLRHVEFLVNNLHPLALSDLPAFANGRPIDKPYFVLTFDDGYRNALTNVAPAATRLGLRPALFVNGLFAQGTVYYRILAALLTTKGHARALAAELRDHDGAVEWSSDGTTLFHQTKDCYRQPGLIEEATEKVYGRCLGDPAALQVHLSPEEIRRLVSQGWEIGNHTYDHPVLSCVDDEGIARTVEGNRSYWNRHGVTLAPFLAFPNGMAKDVGLGVRRYLDEERSLHGLFCNGGVNLKPDRTQWLRVGVYGRLDARGLGSLLSREFERTTLALGDMARRGD